VTRKKLVRVGERTVWAYDNAHDVVLAHLVEVATEDGIPEEVVCQWRNAASIRNLGFVYDGTGITPARLALMLRAVRRRVLIAGDLGPGDLAGWSVLGGCEVSRGVIRGGKLPVRSIIDVIDGLQALLNGSLASAPPNERWLLGPRTGRTSLPLAS